MRPRFARCLLVVAATWVLLSNAAAAGQRGSSPTFASLVAQLSEPGGYFDADNLISNERSYLQVMSSLGKTRMPGGVYIGVGPDQNFSYIAEVKPAMAFVIDIRRDNMLLHLLFKALFELSPTRVEFLSHLFGRPVPPNPAAWRNAKVDRLAVYVENARPSGEQVAALRRRVDRAITRFGVPLSPEDVQTIDRFHTTFISSGLDLKFSTFTRGARSYFPTYRDLLLETDGQGLQSNYLASEERFQIVRSLQLRGLVIPVVGNFAGPHALGAIGDLIASRRLRLSAFYTSNVEYYLFADGSFPRFVANLSRIPHTDRSLIVRSVFAGGIPDRMTQGVAGYASASIVHSMSELLEGYANGDFHEYGELTTVKVPTVLSPGR